jgi:hypothetical protein
MLIFPPCGLSNLVAQSDQLAPLLIQMSGVRLEQRKQDLIGHGEVMLHLAPARISYEIRKAIDQTRNFLTPQAMLGHSGMENGLCGISVTVSHVPPWNRPSRLNLPMEFWNHHHNRGR